MSNEGLPEECGKEQNGAVTGLLLLLPVTKADSKPFCPMSRIVPVKARPAPQR